MKQLIRALFLCLVASALGAACEDLSDDRGTDGSDSEQSHSDSGSDSESAVDSQTNEGTSSHQDTGTGSHQDTGTGSHQDTGTGSHQDTGTGSHQDTGTGSHQDTGTGVDTDDPCLGITAQGCCDGDTVWWCFNGGLMHVDCDGYPCGWDDPLGASCNDFETPPDGYQLECQAF